MILFTLPLAIIVVTNAIVLHEIEAGADVRTVLIQGHRTHVCPILITAAATRVVGCVRSWQRTYPPRPKGASPG